MRREEIESLDLLQTTSIIYHPESLIELLIFGSITILYVGANVESPNYSKLNSIQISLLSAHAYSYISNIYRSAEIYNNGVVDANGVMRGYYE